MEKRLRREKGAPVTLYGVLVFCTANGASWSCAGEGSKDKPRRAGEGRLNGWGEDEGLILEHQVGALGLTAGPRDWGCGGIMGRGCEGDLAPDFTHFTSCQGAVPG